MQTRRDLEAQFIQHVQHNYGCQHGKE